jgi:hypothetical protein
MDRLVDLGVSIEGTPALAARGDELWVGLGDVVLELDAETLAERGRIDSPVAVEGLTALDDGSLLVAGDDRVVQIDRAGRVIAAISLPADVPIISLTAA